MINGILGKKLGMIQYYDSERAVPVSVIEAGPCLVLSKRSIENDGYAAVQIGFMEKKEKHSNKPLLGYFAKLQLKPMKVLKEFSVTGKDEYQVGQKIGAEIFEAGEYVNVTGTSKGKGFQGVIKRHGAHGGPTTHGGMSHRRVGSIGQSSDPSRVFKGHIMPGRMGGEQTTILNLEVIKVDPEKNLLLVKGAIPGCNNGVLLISKTGRKKKAAAVVKAKQDTKAKMVKAAKKAAAAKKK